MHSGLNKNLLWHLIFFSYCAAGRYNLKTMFLSNCIFSFLEDVEWVQFVVVVEIIEQQYMWKRCNILTEVLHHSSTFSFQHSMCCHGVYRNRWEKSHCFFYVATAVSSLFCLSKSLVTCNPMSLLKQTNVSLRRDVGLRLKDEPHFYLQAETEMINLFMNQLWCTAFLQQAEEV